MTKEHIGIELSMHLSIMNIPESRKHLTENNLMWMLRNMGIKNSNHPKFERAMICVRLLLMILK